MILPLMAALVQQVARQDIRASTSKAYKYAIRRYARYMLAFGFNARKPLVEFVLCLLCCCHVASGLAFSSLPGFVSAISYFHILRFKLPLPRSHLYRRVMRGLSNLCAYQTSSSSAAVTIHILHKLFLVLPLMGDTYQQSLIWAMACIAYAGLLRAGEYCTSSFTTACLSHTPYGLDACLSFTKTSLTPVSIPLSSRGDFACPVAAVRAYFGVRGAYNASTPIFCSHPASSSPVSPAAWNKILKIWCRRAGLSDRFTAHGFRRGGATDLHRAGVSETMIKALGRWKSSAFMKYIQLDMHVKVAAQRRLLRVR
jgi:hypothetical protein